MDSNLKSLLIKYGFNFKKAFGQNFLTDESLLNEIVKRSNVKSGDTVLEIGCGAGALTKRLSKSVKNVIGYEIDLKLKPLLNEVLKDTFNTEIIFKDILKEKLESVEKDLPDGYVMVANLPYYITTPIIMRFLENSKKIKSMVIMVQKEVAERLCAVNNSSSYGAITVAINLRGSATKILDVNKEMFTPVPSVDSAVVKIDIDKNKNKDVDLKSVRDIVRIAFSSRRKMLINNIMSAYKLPREKAEQILIKSGIDTTLRGETLSAEEFIILSQNIKENL